MTVTTTANVRSRKERAPHIALLRSGRLVLAAVVTLISTSHVALSEAQLNGSVTVALQWDAVTLDALRVDIPSIFGVTSQIAETLFYTTIKGQVAPGLAESYSLSPDGRIWTLRLRKGVRFHDGTPFDAAAVRFNLQRPSQLASKAPYRWLLSSVASIDIVDDHTLRITTAAPFPSLPAALAHGAFAIQSPSAINTNGDGYGSRPVGTGPFTLRQWDKGQNIVLVRNSQYWGRPATLNTLKFRIIPEEVVRIAAIKTGEVNVLLNVSPDSLPDIESVNSGGRRLIDIVKVPVPRVIYVGINSTQAPFSDVRVRQALNYAVNKDDIVRAITGGLWRVADAPISPEVAMYQRIMTYDYNQARAKALLKDAGFAGGLTTSLHCPHDLVSSAVRVCDALSSQLRSVGINVEVKTLDAAKLFQLLRSANTQPEMYLMTSTAYTGDADSALYRSFHSSQLLPAGYSSARVSELLERGRTAGPGTDRKGIYQIAMSTILQDAPWLFLFNEVRAAAVRRSGDASKLAVTYCPHCEGPKGVATDCDKCGCNDSDGVCKRDCSKCQ